MEALQRKIGPFAVWQWAIVAVVGIGLGLLIRRQLQQAPQGAANESLAFPVGPADRVAGTQGVAVSPTFGPDFSGQRVIVNEINRLREELLAREENDDGVGDSANVFGGVAPGPTGVCPVGTVYVDLLGTCVPVSSHVQPIG